MSGINTNYSQFYKGTQQIKGYGSESGQKDTVVHYQFNTTDEEGNKIMDKMSKEETYRTMNEISAQYGSNVIVEFSGDGLTALEEHKGKIPLPEEHREIPEDMITYLEGPKALTDEQIAEVTRKNGDDMEAIMKRVDPDAYKEYQEISKSGAATGTTSDMVAGFRYMYKWITNKAQSDPNWLVKEKENTGVLENLSSKYGNANVLIGGDGSLLQGDKEYSIILSDEELEILKNGSNEEKDKLLKMIDDSLNDLQKMREKYADKYPDGVFRFGISIGNDGRRSFLAQGGSDVFSAASTEELLQIIDNKSQGV